MGSSLVSGGEAALKAAKFAVDIVTDPSALPRYLAEGIWSDTYIPEGMAAVAIADGSITSPFLALFGRSARATGMENERNNKPTPAQWLYLLNSTDIQRKLEQGPNLQAILRPSRKPPQIIEELYLTILSRFPTPEEVKTIEAYGRVQTVKPAPAGDSGQAPRRPPNP